jgi:hypothetical protein
METDWNGYTALWTVQASFPGPSYRVLGQAWHVRPQGKIRHSLLESSVLQGGTHH